MAKAKKICKWCGHSIVFDKDKYIKQGYEKGRADGYSQAENDYHKQTEKDRQSSYDCGYEQGRADAEEDAENRMQRILDDEKRLSYEKGRTDAIKEFATAYRHAELIGCEDCRHLDDNVRCWECIAEQLKEQKK